MWDGNYFPCVSVRLTIGEKGVEHGNISSDFLGGMASRFQSVDTLPGEGSTFALPAVRGAAKHVDRICASPDLATQRPNYSTKPVSFSDHSLAMVTIGVKKKRNIYWELRKFQDLLKYRLAHTYTLERKSNYLQIIHTPYLTRMSERWHVPRSHTNYTLQMIGYTLPKLLNRLVFIGFDIDSCTKSMLYNLFVPKDYNVWEQFFVAYIFFLITIAFTSLCALVDALSIVVLKILYFQCQFCLTPTSCVYVLRFLFFFPRHCCF